VFFFSLTKSGKGAFYFSFFVGPARRKKKKFFFFRGGGGVS